MKRRLFRFFANKHFPAPDCEGSYRNWPSVYGHVFLYRVKDTDIYIPGWEEMGTG
jgi:hypothetical protein